ncbi:hypothetical protein ANN_08314 [Periplaneta americana]|uniref:Uncharacterized protein n=1 Tax=Periplaneta americana TaxID=6978 RepID=A0ABQ8T2G1_PERAM|nr:hypothetical protein ANN_08314 [Periplaneta americana]
MPCPSQTSGFNVPNYVSSMEMERTGDEQHSRKQDYSARKAKNPHDNVVLRRVLDVKTGLGRTRGKAKSRKMGVRSYNVGPIHGEEKTRTTKAQMGRHTRSEGRKTVVKNSKRQEKVEGTRVTLKKPAKKEPYGFSVGCQTLYRRGLDPEQRY